MQQLLSRIRPWRYARAVDTYLSLPSLSVFVLEESWVLDVLIQPSAVTVDLDLCYARDHPELRAPRAGEYARFRRGRILFGGVTNVSWQAMGQQPATDASGEKDWGHIDSFVWAATSYKFEGDFGQISLQAATLGVELTGAA